MHPSLGSHSMLRVRAFKSLHGHELVVVDATNPIRATVQTSSLMQPPRALLLPLFRLRCPICLRLSRSWFDFVWFMFISTYISASNDGLSGLENFDGIRPCIWNSLFFAYDCKCPHAPLSCNSAFTLRGRGIYVSHWDGKIGLTLCCVKNTPDF